jgi:uncharacterized SAM-binding protein YcdF (DUF218 family)
LVSQPPKKRSRISHRIPRKKSWRKRLGWKPRVAIAAFAALLALLAWAAIARRLAPTSNTSVGRFDAIVVLGSPADRDGNPTPRQLARVTEAVQEYKRGVAQHLILTGGRDHNRFAEANVMARSAEAQGIPESAIFLEPHATDTIQNACYSFRIMKAHGWHSAEVVSSGYHLPRAGLILSSLARSSLALNSPPLEWRTHPAPSLSPQSPAYESAVATVEVLKTARYLIWARWADQCEP